MNSLVFLLKSTLDLPAFLHSVCQAVALSSLPEEC